MHTFHLAGPTRDRSEFRGTAWAGDEIRGSTRCQVNRWRCAPTDVEFLRIAYSSALRRCAAHHRSHCVGCAGGRWDTGACGRWSGRTRGGGTGARGGPRWGLARREDSSAAPRSTLAASTNRKATTISGACSRSAGVVNSDHLRSRFSLGRTQMPLKPLISSRARIFWEDRPPRTLSALLVGGGGAIKNRSKGAS